MLDDALDDAVRLNFTPALFMFIYKMTSYVLHQM